MTCRRFRKTMVKKQRSFASRSSSSSRPGLDEAASALSRSSLGGERVRGSTQVSKHRSHGTPGPKSLTRRAIQRSTPARPLTRDLAGKYGDPAVSQVILRGSNLLTVRTPHRAILPWARYLQDRSPRSESICPVERPSSCDTGHYARLATKGSVQQSPVDRPVYSEHARSHRDPVNPVTDYRPGPGT